MVNRTVIRVVGGPKPHQVPSASGLANVSSLVLIRLPPPPHFTLVDAAGHGAGILMEFPERLQRHHSASVIHMNFSQVRLIPMLAQRMRDFRYYVSIHEKANLVDYRQK